MEISVRNYITKTVTKCWVKNPKNFNKSKTKLHELLDDTSLFKVRGNEYIELFAISDDVNKILFAVGGRNIVLQRKAEENFLKLGYVLALHGTLSSPEIEALFPNIADSFIINQKGGVS